MSHPTHNATENTYSRKLYPLTESEASQLTKKLRYSTFLNNRAVVLTVEPHDEPLHLNDGTTLPAFRLVITSENESFTAQAYGFILAVHERLNRAEPERSRGMLRQVRIGATYIYGRQYTRVVRQVDGSPERVHGYIVVTPNGVETYVGGTYFRASASPSAIHPVR